MYVSLLVSRQNAEHFLASMTNWLSAADLEESPQGQGSELVVDEWDRKGKFGTKERFAGVETGCHAFFVSLDSIVYLE